MKSNHLLIFTFILLFSCSVDQDTPDAYGNFEATEIMVSSMAQGKILSLTAEEGQFIENGAVTGMVDTTNLYLQKEQLIKKTQAIRSKIASISAQIAVHEQQKKNLMVDKDRLDNLYKEGAATKKQLDDIKGAIDLVKAQIEAVNSERNSIFREIEALEKQIEQVEETIKNCYITNPINGIVLTKFAEAGEVTAYGRPIYKIADLDDIKLKVYVSGLQLAHIKLGQEVEVYIDEDETTNRKFTGNISWISSTAEFTPKTIQTKDERVNLVYAIKVSVKNDGTLKIGMPGEIRLINNE